MATKPVGRDTIKWMHSEQLGAPQLLATPESVGQLLEVLDACLINGFSSQPVASAEITPVGVTLNMADDHFFSDRQIISISGADDENLNGEHRIHSISGRSISVEVANVATASGFIVIKQAPLDWESIAEVTAPLKRAYRSKNTDGTRTVLHLDMNLPAGGGGYNATNPAHRAAITLCEDIGADGSVVRPYALDLLPTALEPNGSMFWHQSRGFERNRVDINLFPAHWVIVGNGDYFYFMFNQTTFSGSNRHLPHRGLFMFGDIPIFGGEPNRYKSLWLGSLMKDDVGRANASPNGGILTGLAGLPDMTTAAGIFPDPAVLSGATYTTSSYYLASLTLTGYYESSYSISGYDKQPKFPNPINDGVVTLPIYVGSEHGVVGIMPSIHFLTSDLSAYSYTSFDLRVIDGMLLVAVSGQTITNMANKYAYYAFDLGA